MIAFIHDFAARMLHTPPYGEVILKKGIIIFHGWELVYLEEVCDKLVAAKSDED